MVMLYFSATGNSKYIAELFCLNSSSACHSIEEDVDYDNLIISEDIICFCYPVYGSRVPRLMREFVIKHMESLNNKKLVIFCTQMYFSGDGARAFTDIFPRGFIEVIYAEHFLMPNNVCNVFITPLPGKETIQRYLSKADIKMQTVCDDIANGVIKKRGFNRISRALGLIQGTFFPRIEKWAQERVWVDNDCNKCQLCVSICPTHNFDYNGDTVETKNNCMMCFRCINKCPQKAIAVSLHGKVKRQYKGVESLSSQ